MTTTLTKQQRAVLRLTRAGKGLSAIGALLGISRQRVWQIIQVVSRHCMICGKKSFVANYCRDCRNRRLEMHREATRKWRRDR